jgi:PIN domain nuclease of toxin-antitoxin system
MRVLLDTHAFIWWDGAPEHLSPKAREACFAPGNQLIVSVAGLWEIQIKVMLGKLTLRKPLREIVTGQVKQNGVVILPVELEHVLRLDQLPSYHKDPFDRILVAQALVEGLPLISHDPVVAQYPVNVIW